MKRYPLGGIKLRTYTEDESVSWSGGYTGLYWSEGKDGFVISTVPRQSTASGIFPTSLQAWGRRKRIRVNHFSPSTPVPIKLFYTTGSDSGSTIYLSSLAQTDFDDVRFTKEDKSAALNYWIYDKTDSNSAHLYTNLPNASTGRIYSTTGDEFPTVMGDYGKRKRFVITDPVKSAPITVKVIFSGGTDSGSTVYLSNAVQTDFDDVRFTKEDKSTTLDQWRMDYDTGNSALYRVKVPGNLDSTLYLYYNHAGGSLSSDPSSIMFQVDDCEGGSVKWTKVKDTSPSVIFPSNLSAYSRRKRFVIDNHYASAALRLHIFWSGGTDADSDVYLSNVAQANFDDIRFAKGDTSTLISQWKEDHTAGDSAIYYIELPGTGGSDSTLYMYYGSSAGPSSSDISSVMFISDDCEGTNPYSKWVSSQDGTLALSYTTDRHKFGTKSLKFEFSGGTNDIDISTGVSAPHWRQVIWQYIKDFSPLRRTYFWIRGTHSIAATVTHNVGAGKSTGEINWFDGTWHSTNYHARSNAWNGFMFDARSSNNVIDMYAWSANNWKNIATSIARETNFGKSRGLRVRTTGTSGATYFDNIYSYYTTDAHPTVSNAFYSVVTSTIGISSDIISTSYSTGHYKHGTKGLKVDYSVVGGASVATHFSTTSDLDANHWRNEHWIKIPSLAGAGYVAFGQLNNSASNWLYAVKISSVSGKLEFLDSATNWTALNKTLPEDQWVGFRAVCESATDTVELWWDSSGDWTQIHSNICFDKPSCPRYFKYHMTASGVLYADTIHSYYTSAVHPAISGFHSAVDSAVSGHSVGYNDMYIYYNNTTASQGSDPSSVTLWVDDGEGTDPYSKWKITGSYANISAFYSAGIVKHMTKSLKLELSTGGGNNLIISTATRSNHFRNTLWFYAPKLNHTIDLLHYGSVGASGPTYQMRLSAGLIKVYSASAYTTIGRNYDSTEWLGMRFDMDSAGTSQKLYVYSASAWANYSNANLTQGTPRSHRFLIQPVAGISGVVYFDTIYGYHTSSAHPIVSATHSAVSSGYQDSTTQRMSGVYSSLTQDPSNISSLVYYYAKIGDIDTQSVTFKLYDSAGDSIITNGSHNYLEDLRTVSPEPFYFQVLMKQLSTTKSSPVFREWGYGYTKSAPTIEQHKSVTLGGSTVNLLTPRQYNLSKNTIPIPLINASAPAIQEYGGSFWNFDNIEFTSYKSAIIDSIVKAVQHGSHLQINFGGLDDEKQTYSVSFNRISKTKRGGEEYYRATGEGVII